MIKLKVFLLISISVTIHLAITVICKPVGGEEKGKEIEKDVVPQKSSNLTRKFPRIKKGKLRTIKHLKKYRPLITEDLQHSYDDEMNWYIEAKNRSQKQKSKLKKPELSEKKRKRYQKDYDWSKYDKFTTKRAASDILVESGLPKLPPSKYHVNSQTHGREEESDLSEPLLKKPHHESSPHHESPSHLNLELGSPHHHSNPTIHKEKESEPKSKSKLKPFRLGNPETMNHFKKYHQDIHEDLKEPYNIALSEYANHKGLTQAHKQVLKTKGVINDYRQLVKERYDDAKKIKDQARDDANEILKKSDVPTLPIKHKHLKTHQAETSL